VTKAPLLLVLGWIVSPAPGQTSRPEPMPTVPTVQRDDRLDDEVRHIDPGVDGWDTESLNGAAGAQLKKLVGTTGDSAARLSSMVTDGFTCTELRPVATTAVFSDPAYEVRRGTAGGERLRGPEGLATALAGLLDRFESTPHHKFKVVRVVPGVERRFTTEVLHQAWGETAAGRLQLNATWNAHWSWPNAEQPPRLTALDLLRYEEISTQQPLFVDCTESAFSNGRDHR
jgi:hypothetical protein